MTARPRSGTGTFEPPLGAAVHGLGAAPDRRDPGQTRTLHPGTRTSAHDPNRHLAAWHPKRASSLASCVLCSNLDWHPAAWDLDQPHTLHLAATTLHPALRHPAAWYPNTAHTLQSVPKTCLHPAQIALTLHSLAPAPSPLSASPSRELKFLLWGTVGLWGRAVGMRGTAAGCDDHGAPRLCSGHRCLHYRAGSSAQSCFTSGLYPAPTNSALQ